MNTPSTNSSNRDREEQLPLVSIDREKSASTKREGFALWRFIRKIRYLPLVMLFGATVGVIALYFQPPGLQKIMGILKLEPGGGTRSPIAVPANPRKSEKPAEDVNEVQQIIGLGKLLPDGDVRVVSPPFGAGDARIAVLHVAEGERVIVGDRLASLDNEPNIRASIENAKSTLRVREATLNQIKNSVMISRDEARASLQRANSALLNAQGDYDRTLKLFERGFTTNAVLELKLSARDQAQGEVHRLRATLARFEAGNIDEQPDVVVAARNLDAARSDLNRAQSDLSKAQVLAPTNGTILNIHVHAGERPGTKGIMDIGNIDKMTADIEIYQSQIGAIKLGAKVEMTAEALTQTLHGIVSTIGLEVGRQTLIDSDPAANTDARIVLVNVLLDEASSKAAKRFTNLQVLARIMVSAQ